jgi:hypothetical protein
MSTYMPSSVAATADAPESDQFSDVNALRNTPSSSCRLLQDEYQTIVLQAGKPLVVAACPNLEKWAKLLRRPVENSGVGLLRRRVEHSHTGELVVPTYQPYGSLGGLAPPSSLVCNSATPLSSFYERFGII